MTSTRARVSQFPHPNGRRLLAAAVMMALAASGSVSARDLIGGSAVVSPGDPAEAWNVAGATFSIVPGGQALNVVANSRSTLNFDGASLGVAPAASSAFALEVTRSTATITDSTITGRVAFNAETVANVVGGTFNSTGTAAGVIVEPGAVATLSGTSITATGRGLMVGGTGTSGIRSAVPGQATLTNSTVVGGGSRRRWRQQRRPASVGWIAGDRYEPSRRWTVLRPD